MAARSNSNGFLTTAPPSLQGDGESLASPARSTLPRPAAACIAASAFAAVPPSRLCRRPARGQRRRGVDEYAAPRKLCGVVGPPGTVHSSRSGCGSGNVDTTAQRPAEWPVLPVSVPLLGKAPVAPKTVPFRN